MTESHRVSVTGLFVYPIKSLRGVRVEEARLEGGRLARDRDFVLIDETDHFMHQRDYRQMARVGVELLPDGLRVHVHGLAPLDIAQPNGAPAAGSHCMYVQLWRRAVPVVPVNPDVDDWFSGVLGVPCRLMAFLPDRPAINVPDYERLASLHDATPFHLTSEDSLSELNGRMATPVPMNRFRPNIVVRGAVPYSEDRWARIAIGQHTILRWIKACTRCTITMTDQETGVRADKEPLRTLATYRRQGSEVVFGHYLVADRWGDALRVGDEVSVVEWHRAREADVAPGMDGVVGITT